MWGLWSSRSFMMHPWNSRKCRKIVCLDTHVSFGHRKSKGTMIFTAICGHGRLRKDRNRTTGSRSFPLSLQVHASLNVASPTVGTTTHLPLLTGLCGKKAHVCVAKFFLCSQRERFWPSSPYMEKTGAVFSIEENPVTRMQILFPGRKKTKASRNLHCWHETPWRKDTGPRA
jgi:hypothetical protein